jgi:hypothetical protein
VKPVGFGVYYSYMVDPIHSMWNEQFMVHSWFAQEGSTPVTVEFGLPSHSTVASSYLHATNTAGAVELISAKLNLIAQLYRINTVAEPEAPPSTSKIKRLRLTAARTSPAGGLYQAGTLL